MKTIDLNVKLTFSDNVEYQHLISILEKTAQAIVNEARNGTGIAPDECDYYTESVEISHMNAMHSINKSVY